MELLATAARPARGDKRGTETEGTNDPFIRAGPVHFEIKHLLCGNEDQGARICRPQQGQQRTKNAIRGERVP